ncbi:MAG: hypothetical protein GY862_31920 [Gammaproteobacteria bacterium]|nr:hypothetical protein [Gammaproteobacteria bacterium]
MPKTPAMVKIGGEQSQSPPEQVHAHNFVPFWGLRCVSARGPNAPTRLKVMGFGAGKTMPKTTIGARLYPSYNPGYACSSLKPAQSKSVI